MSRWALAILAAALFHLRDGRVVEVADWIQHGDEYVVTLPDGTALILRQSEVREIAPAPPSPGTGAPPRPAPRPLGTP